MEYRRLIGRSPLADLDFGDAEYLATWGGYPTLLAQDGARHNIGGPWLGDASDSPDIEPDGQPDASALGDDSDGSDDENGVTIETLYPGHISDILIEVSGGGGIVEAWIDFDHDRNWDHPGEQVFAGYLSDGSHTIQVATVTNAAIGQTVARFRISTAGDLSPAGEAPDGEVEDYEVMIQDQTTGTDDGPVPSSFRAYQNFPNPFNPLTTIQFDLPDPQRVMVVVFAADGSRIATLADRDMTAGRHRVTWDGRNATGTLVASGVYFYRIMAGPYLEAGRMVLIR